MHIEFTPENLLVQLGYPANSALIEQSERIIASTGNFNSFSRHLLSLKDELAHFDGYMAFSNSRDALKIKCDSTNSETLAAYTDTLKNWSEKYKVTLENVKGTNTYYILGQKQ